MIYISTYCFFSHHKREVIKQCIKLLSSMLSDDLSARYNKSVQKIQGL